MLGEPGALCGEELPTAWRGGRHPAPNYRADFVEAHNPSLAQVASPPARHPPSSQGDTSASRGCLSGPTPQ